MNNPSIDLQWMDADFFNQNEAMRRAKTTAGQEVTALQVKLAQKLPYFQHDIFMDHKAPDIDPIDWHLLEVIPGETAGDLLERCDQFYYKRIKAELDQSCSICFDMHQVEKKIRWHLMGHVVRRDLFKRVLLEAQMAPPPPIVVSKEYFDRYFLGIFERNPATCKCGTAWESMLYGATCGRCGESRPKHPAIAINVIR